MVRFNEDLERAATKKPINYKEVPAEENESDESATIEPSGESIRKKSKHNPTETFDVTVPQSSSRQRRQTQAATTRPQGQPAGSRRTRMETAITELKRAGKDTLSYCDTIPLKSEPELHPPACNLALLKLSTAALPFLDESTLYGWLASNDILPCIRQWKQECLDNERIRSSLQAALPADDFPFEGTTDFLSRKAPKYATIINQQAGLQHPQAEAMLPCLKYIRRLKRSSMAHFMHFLVDSQYPNLDEFIYTFCTRAILTAYVDLLTNGASGFFGVMLDSRYAEPMILLARRAWDKLLILPGSSSGIDSENCKSSICAASIAFAAGRTQEAMNVSLSPENNQDQYWEAIMMCHRLQNEFTQAVGESPEIMTVVPSEIGQTDMRNVRKHEQKAGFPRQPTFKSLIEKPECDPLCVKPDLHTRDCSKRVQKAEEAFRRNRDGGHLSVEAEVPAMGTPLDSTISAGPLIPPEKVITAFNQRDIIDPFSDEEKALTFKMFRLYLDLETGNPKMDASFEWTLISEVLPGRGVADCVRFYYQNKHIIDMRLKPAPTGPLLKSGDPPKWGPFMDEALKTKLRKHFDVDRYLEFIANLEEENTNLQIKSDEDTSAARQYEQTLTFEKRRAEGHKAKREEYEARDEERKKEIADMKAANKEQKNEIASLKAAMEEMKLKNSRPKAVDEERKKESAGLKADMEKMKQENQKERKGLKAEIERLSGLVRKLQPDKPAITYGKMPPGFGFLEGQTFQPTRKQWRGEK